MTNDLDDNRTPRSDEAGFALVLALLCLMVLTFLGMTLATTTSTELQIATNYRWSQQALYNAEAGIELGKRFLRQLEWRTVVGDPREASGECLNPAPDPGCEMHRPPGDWTLDRVGPDGEPGRSWERSGCDDGNWGGFVGYGNVFDHITFAMPLQNSSDFLGEQLNGTFTLWVRRATEQVQVAGGWAMQDSLDRLILTAEGTAPYLGASNVENRAVRYLQSEVQRIDPSGCENYSGQEGLGPSGSNYDACSNLGTGGLDQLAAAAGSPGSSIDEPGADTQ